MKKSIKKMNWDKIREELKKQNKILKEWMEKNYGKRCSEYCKGCALCKQWKLFDKLKLLDK